MVEKKFNIWCSILALANKPESGVSILDWCPFEGCEPLWEIVRRRNDRIFDLWKKDGCMPEDSAEGIRVDPRDLSNLNKVSQDDFINKNIRILLVDSEAFDKEKNLNKRGLDEFKDRMGSARAVFRERVKKTGLPIPPWIYHITQLSQKSNAPSIQPFFEPLPKSFRILRNQKDLENFLDRYSDSYREAYRSISSMDPTKEAMLINSPSAEARFSKAIPAISARARDDVLCKEGLQDHQIGIYAKAYAKAEAIDQAFRIKISEKEGPVALNSLRQQPLYSVPIETLMGEPHLKEEQLVKLTLSQPWAEISKDQSETLKDLGLMPGVNSTVHLDSQALQEEVQKMDDMIQIKKFQFELPSWE